MMHTITKGPRKLSQALGIKQNFDAVKLYDPKSPIQILNAGTNYSESEIGISKRIGVESAGESADWPFRFISKEICMSVVKNVTGFNCSLAIGFHAL